MPSFFDWSETGTTALGPLQLLGAIGRQGRTLFTQGLGGLLASIGEQPEYNMSPLDTKGVRRPEAYGTEPTSPELAATGRNIAHAYPAPDLSTVPWWQRQVVGAGGSVLNMAPALALGPVGGAAYLGGNVFGQSYIGSEGQGLTPQERMDKASLDAVIEGATEYSPLKFLKGESGRGVLGFLGGLAKREIPGELAAETGQSGTDYIYGTSEAKTPSDWVDSLPGLWRDTAAQAAIGAGMQTGAIKAGQSIGQGIREARMASPETGIEAGTVHGGVPGLNAITDSIAWLGKQGTEFTQRKLAERKKIGKAQVTVFGEPQVQEGDITPLDLLVTKPEQALDLLDPGNRIAGISAVGANMNYIQGDQQLKDFMTNASIINQAEIDAFRAGKLPVTDVRKKMTMEDKVKFDNSVRSWHLTGLEKDYLYYNKDAVNAILGKKKGTALNAAELSTVAQLQVDAAVAPWQYAKNMQEKQARGEPINDRDLMEFQLLLEKFAWVQAKMAGFRAEAGRSLNIMKRISRQSKDITEWQKAMSEATGVDERARLQDIMSRMMETKDLNHAMQFIRDVRAGAPVHSIWLSSMLSSPKTWITNLFSNTAVLLHQGAEDLAGTVVGSARVARAQIAANHVINKAQREGTDMNAAMVEAQNILAKAKAESNTWSDFAKKYKPYSKAGESVAADIEDALLIGMNTFLTGVEIDPSSSVLEHGGQQAGTLLRSKTGRQIKGTSVLTTPTRILAATDNAFKTVAYQGELRKLISQEARGRLQREMEASGRLWTEAERTTRLEELNTQLTKWKPKEIMEKAWKHARYVTFTNELGAFGQKVMDLRRIRQRNQHGEYVLSPGGVAMSAAIPFFRTPVNLLKYAADRGATLVPMGALVPGTRFWDIVKMRHGYTNADRQKLAGSLVLNAAVTYGFIQLAGLGMLTGDTPEDPGEREVWLMNNKPFSVRTPEGTSVDLARADPFGLWAGTLATSVQTIERARNAGVLDDRTAVQRTQDLIIYASLGLLDVMSEKSYAKSFGELVSAMRGEDVNLLSSAIGGFVPNAFGDLNILLEGKPLTKKDTRVYGRSLENMGAFEQWLRGLKNELSARTDSADHWGRKALPDRIDLRGNPVPLSPYVGPQHGNHISIWNRLMETVNPLAVTQQKRDPVIADMAMLNYFPEDPATRHQRFGVPLQPEETVIFKKNRNKKAFEVFDQIVAKGYWAQYNDAQKLFIMREVFEKAGTFGDIMLLKEKPGLIRARGAYKLEARLEKLLGPHWKEKISQGQLDFLNFNKFYGLE